MDWILLDLEGIAHSLAPFQLEKSTTISQSPKDRRRTMNYLPNISFKSTINII